MTTPAGAPCWVDLSTSDVGAAKEFYGALLGWTFREMGEEYGGYAIVELDGRAIAGIGPKMGEDVPDAWTIYLRVDDAARAASLIDARGGTVMVAAMPIPEMGTMAIAMDPAGAVFGIWQPGPFEGFEVDGVPGAPAWFETMSIDAAAAVPFYRDALGWDVHVMSDSSEFRYWTNGEGDDAVCGLMDARGMFGGDAPSFWQWYVLVEDADALVAKVEGLGGRVMSEPEDTPYGRLAVVQDATGGMLCLMGTQAS